MCGIFCCIHQARNDSESFAQWNICKDVIAARGPDHLTEKHISLNHHWHGHFAAAVLWMQGSEIITQPSLDDNNNLLLWNGDIFSGCLAKDNDVCDTNVILDELQSTTDIMSVLWKIEGPYSLIYYQKSTDTLYFGRDIIGRHSLLLKIDSKANSLTLTSVANKNMKGIVEVPAIGIFAVNLNNSRINLACYPWKEPDLRFTDIIETLETTLNVDINIRKTILNTNSSLMNLHLHLHPDPKDLEYLENIPDNIDFNETLRYLLENRKVSERVECLAQLLHQSVKVRVKKKPNYCKDCIKTVLNGESITCTHSKIGILFSGGLDSAILAAIADKYVPENESIDLINVAFERSVNNQKISHMNDEKENVMQKYDVPDRKTGRQTYSELLRICPNRKWNFIQCNITQMELQLYRASRISDLLHPLCTILDESLGCAMWFASRAKGVLYPVDEMYESPCRILFLGIGADELFGGYMRHRTILKHKGWDALVRELNIELARISERNLGRDDRIISDHGKQSRLPYLDENVVKYVQDIKPWERCYPTEKMPTGLGDKLLLRLLACKIGFQSTANFPKRAFQFGSRIANANEKGNVTNVIELRLHYR